MKITAIDLQNVRGFERLLRQDFSDSLNIFIGKNNSGKSTILNAIHLIQKTDALTSADQTVGTINGQVRLYCKENHKTTFLPDVNRLGFVFHLNDARRHILSSNGGEAGWGGQTSLEEPDNLIYPYLSKRKVLDYSPEIHKAAENAVTGNLVHLPAKILRSNDPQDDRYQEYTDACKSILGFNISTSGNGGSGRKVAYKLSGDEEIPLTSMGEGVANLLGLIVTLCGAENKIFLIEEPENDIHPMALKGLLDLIIKKSNTNQFFISTHSNVVMRVLGSKSDAKIFEVSSSLTDVERPKLFISEMREIVTPEDRRNVLEELGYEFFDFGQHEGYLLLEESSAEKLIREHLIPMFVPDLEGRIRTYSTRGIDRVTQRFEDLNGLFTFVHLEPVYKNKAWVIVDGGGSSNEILDKLKKLYVEGNGWNENNFSQLSNHDFEEYYPEQFRNHFVENIKGIQNKKDRQAQKLQLLEDVIGWIKENPDEAKSALEQCAEEVISKLKEIEKSL